MPKRKLQRGEAVRALVARECRAVERALAHERVVDESIHDARKAIRRLRSVLVLVGDGVAGLPAIDRALQRLGGSLSSLRDAHVALVAARRLAEADPAAAWAAAIDSLAQREAALLKQVFARDPGFVRVRAAIRRIDGRLQRLNWPPIEAKALRAAVGRSQARAARAEQRARTEPTPGNVHRWRRRTRRLRMQLEALEAFAPGIAKSLAEPSLRKQLKALRELGDILGWSQDLRVLQARVGRMPGLPQRAALLAQVRAAANGARPR